MTFIVYDFEVFKYDWGVIFKEIKSDGIINTYEIRNDREKLLVFFNQHKGEIFVGFNNKHYDKWIMLAILEGQDPYEISKKIIEKHIFGWTLIKSFKSFINLDLKDELAPDLSLKEIEANLGKSIIETPVDFNLNRKLTESEFDEVMKYCDYDVITTISLLTAREKWIQAKIDLIKLYDLDISNITKTSAQLIALILKAKRVSRNHILDYKEYIPKELKLNEYKNVLDFYTEKPIEEAIKMNQKINGVEHIISTGGIHGALERVFFKTDNDGIVLHLDVESYYPALMIEYNLLSRNVPNPLMFKEIRDLRIEKKKQNDPLEFPLKIGIAATYGASNQPGNTLYDPMMRMNVCVTGQLFLIDLIEKIQPHCFLIQSNTDGIIIKVPFDFFKDFEKAVYEWQQRTRFRLKTTPINFIWQKDVNNYIMVSKKNNIKVKGAFVKQFGKISFEKNNAAIIDIAVVNFFLQFKKPQETIIDYNLPLINYQLISKSGRSYFKNTFEKKGEEIIIQKLNRVFAVKEGGQLFKYKKNKDGSLSKQKIPNMPANGIIINEEIHNIKLKDSSLKNSLDFNFYINEAWKRIKQYLSDSSFKLLMNNLG